MSDFKAEMHQIRFSLGSLVLTAFPPDPLAGVIVILKLFL